MNYLAHYFFYHDESPYHNAGLLLPDLSRAAIGRRELRIVGPWDDPDEAIARGCGGHYHADAWFHESAYFKQVSDKINKEITQEKLKGKRFKDQRSWFIGHILAEMLLDRVIMEKHTDALDAMYHDLNRVEIDSLSHFLLQAGKDHLGRFPEVFDGFRSSEFLRHYSSFEGIIGSLSRVLVRTKQAPLSDPETTFLLQRMAFWLDQAVEIKKPRQMARL